MALRSRSRARLLAVVVALAMGALGHDGAGRADPIAGVGHIVRTAAEVVRDGTARIARGLRGTRARPGAPRRARARLRPAALPARGEDLPGTGGAIHKIRLGQDDGWPHGSVP